MQRIRTLKTRALAVGLLIWALSAAQFTLAAQARAPAADKVAALRSSTKLDRLPANEPANEPANDRAAKDFPPRAIYADLMLRSASALVADQLTHRILYAKNVDSVQPIASITKLMTAMVVLDSRLPLNAPVTITEADLDQRRHTGSRLRVGVTLPRAALLRIMLMASDNRAAHALARNYPGGSTKFVARMNLAAEHAGLSHTMFADASGLSTANVSSARDLATLVHLAHKYEIIREYSTTASYPIVLSTPRGNQLTVFRNTNLLTRDVGWTIGLSKTGYINESGQCLVLRAIVAGRPVAIVLLDSYGKYSRIGDANRIKQWLERHRDVLLRS
jgi:serine-type D-Ala-D-Ala endopeptidase (penicillin-binding protein 7)